MTPAELEARIKREYAQAYGDIHREAAAYFNNLPSRISINQARVQSGEITQAYYNSWLLNQIGRGQRYQDLENKIADRLLTAQQIAAEYINDTTPVIYALNRNYSAYQIATAYNQKGTAWTAWDETTVKRLLENDNLQLVPFAKTILNINKANAWNRDHIQSALTSAILSGHSVDKLADSFEALTLMDRNSSLRNARTALTGAQNAGRQQAYEEAREMGIEIKKEWICTQDTRTRDTHADLDGQIVDYNAPFITTNGVAIQYPGDPTAPPGEVWNCRCTMRAVLPKYTKTDRPTYKDWLEEHGATSQEAKQEATEAQRTAQAQDKRLTDEIRKLNEAGQKALNKPNEKGKA